MTDLASLTPAATEGGHEAGAAASASPADEILLGGEKGKASAGAFPGAGTEGRGEAGDAPNALDAASRQAAAERLTALREQHWQDFQTQQMQTMREHSQQWHRQCKDDPELGGDRLTVSVARAQMALDRFDDKGHVGQWLHQSGFGNHPEILRFFNRVADALGDDAVINGQVVREMPSLEDRMYPNWRV